MIVRTFLGGDCLKIIGLGKRSEINTIKTLHGHQFLVRANKEGGRRAYFGTLNEVMYEITDEEYEKNVSLADWREIEIETI